MKYRDDNLIEELKLFFQISVTFWQFYLFLNGQLKSNDYQCGVIVQNVYYLKPSEENKQTFI